MVRSLILVFLGRTGLIIETIQTDDLLQATLFSVLIPAYRSLTR